MKGEAADTRQGECMRGSGIASQSGLWRSRPTVVLVEGMLASMAASAIFYAAASLLHPPTPYGQPGAPSSVGAWLSAYASWSQTDGDLSTCLRASTLAAIAFGAAAGILERPKVAFVGSFVLLNVYFGWSSSAFGAVSIALLHDITKTIYIQDGYVLGLLGMHGVTGNTYVVADLESLAFLIVVAASILVLNRSRGRPRAVLHAVRAVAGCFVILGAEIAVFDYKELYMHATQAQAEFGWATWISNADLLLAGIITFALSWYALRSKGWNWAFKG
jgi:hypothetical protein